MPVSDVDYGNEVKFTKVNGETTYDYSLNPAAADTTLEFLPYGLRVSNIGASYLDNFDGESTIFSIDWGDETYDLRFSMTEA